MTKVEKAKAIVSKSQFIKSNYLSQPGEGFKYIRYRILRPLLKLYTHWGRRKYSPAPWLTPPAIEVFDHILDQNMAGLEYGSGRSTLFFSKRLKSLHSIEHDAEWYKIVKEKLAGLENTELTLIPPVTSALSVDDNFGIEGFEAKQEYSDYFNFVKSFDDDFFDFVLIDGRARVECTLNAIPKLKQGGILALDNSERKRYQPLFRILKDWKMVQTTNGLTDTTIWFKP